MAYTVDQSSGTGLQGAYDEIFYVVRDTVNYNAPKFRYLLKVTIGGTVVGTFKQLPNNNDSAVFLIEQIVASYVRQDENIWQLGLLNSSGASSTSTIFGSNTEAIKEVAVDFGYEKAADADSAPTETWGAATQATFIVVNGSLRAQTFSTTASNSSDNFALTDNGGQFLSCIPPRDTVYNQYVVEGQFGALAFLNGDDVGSDDCNYFHVTYKNAAGATLTTGYFTNDTAQGGKAPAASLPIKSSLLYFGCFPANLENQAISTPLKPSNVSSAWAYYDVQAASSTTLSGNEASAVYRFHKMCNTRYNDVSLSYNKFPGEYYLCWWNSLGGVDNLVFDGASKVMQQVKRETYYSIGGNAFNAGNTTDYNRRSTEGGTTSSGNQTTTNITLNTREQNPEDLNDLIQSLASSPRVYIYNADIQQPFVLGKGKAFLRCVVTDMSVSYNTAINDKVANYTITVQLSRRRPNNL